MRLFRFTRSTASTLVFFAVATPVVLIAVLEENFMESFGLRKPISPEELAQQEIRVQELKEMFPGI